MPKQKTEAKKKEYTSVIKKSRNKEKYVLRLYVAGLSPRSKIAIENMIKICDEHMPGLCDLEVINLLIHPKLAKDEQILAVPTLIKKLPLPIRRLIGDMSDTEKFLVGIDYKPKKKKT
jgi:circadian clock protein KaiB